MAEHAHTVRLRNNLSQSCSFKTLETDYDLHEKSTPLSRTCMGFLTRVHFLSWYWYAVTLENCPFPFLQAIVTGIELTSHLIPGVGTWLRPGQWGAAFLLLWWYHPTSDTSVLPGRQAGKGQRGSWSKKANHREQNAGSDHA